MLRRSTYVACMQITTLVSHSFSAQKTIVSRYSISEQLLGVSENRFHDIEDEIEGADLVLWQLQEGHQRLPLPWLFHLSSDQLHRIRASSGILANKIVTALKQGSPPRPRSHDLNREYSPPPWNRRPGVVYGKIGCVN